MNLPGYDETSICPYNKSHVILKSRFQTHLVKCAKSYPDIIMERCPFDVTHHIRKELLDSHVRNCPSRESYDRYKYNVVTNSQPEPDIPVPKPKCPKEDAEESWDHYDAPTYDPQQYAQNASVLRNLNLAPPSQRSKFRDEERRRLSQLERRE